ncbi:sulfur carrier protein ThiS [Sulfurimonas sp. HSL-1716]|uniref:sulfur carrier protein ThiS n=1 Tax=Hydrocurvibacter sulfurireducens TaxID=3131937 RepID=UPI0031FA3CED
MNITVNGNMREVKEGISMQELINELGLQDKVMAAALNMEVVKQENWASCRLKDKDRVELLDFVGGG